MAASAASYRGCTKRSIGWVSYHLTGCRFGQADQSLQRADFAAQRCRFFGGKAQRVVLLARLVELSLRPAADLVPVTGLEIDHRNKKAPPVGRGLEVCGRTFSRLILLGFFPLSTGGLIFFVFELIVDALEEPFDPTHRVGEVLS